MLEEKYVDALEIAMKKAGDTFATISYDSLATFSQVNKISMDDVMDYVNFGNARLAEQEEKDVQFSGSKKEQPTCADFVKQIVDIYGAQALFAALEEVEAPEPEQKKITDYNSDEFADLVAEKLAAKLSTPAEKAAAREAVEEAQSEAADEAEDEPKSEEPSKTESAEEEAEKIIKEETKSSEPEVKKEAEPEKKTDGEAADEGDGTGPEGKGVKPKENTACEDAKEALEEAKKSDDKEFSYLDAYLEKTSDFIGHATMPPKKQG